MTDHFVKVPKKVLSPAAEAVLDAVFDHWPGGHNHPGKPLCIAAASWRSRRRMRNERRR